MMLQIVVVAGYIGFLVFLMWLMSAIAFKLLGAVSSESVFGEGDIVRNLANPNVKVQVTDIQEGTLYFLGVFVNDAEDAPKILEYEFEKTRFVKV